MSSPSPRFQAASGTALSLGIAAVVTLVLLRAPLSAFGTDLWGPEHPWAPGDFVGAWWMFHAAAGQGIHDAMQTQLWPAGIGHIGREFPNPWDAMLLGPLVAGLSFPLWWNLLQLFHHLANVLAATWLCRTAGARPLSAGVAGAVVAAAPVMLHEIAGGRTLSGAVWPGLLALALLLRGNGAAAGLLIGVQGVLYVYAGLVVGVVALVLRPSRGLLLAALPMLPYLWWLSPAWVDAHDRAPPAGFTQLPLSGLLGLAEVPERFRLSPALLLGALGLVGATGLKRARWALALGLVATVAVGPLPTWDLGSPLFTSPLALFMDGVPTLGRMHHPVRAALLLVPLLAVPFALLLDRLPGPSALLGLLLVLPTADAVRLSAGHGPPGPPPGLDAATWLAQAPDVGAVVDLTGTHGRALALQPVHGRPMLEGLHADRGGPPQSPGGMRAGVEPWLAGRQVDPGALDRLRAAGFTHVLAISRPGFEPMVVPLQGLEADLGPPVAPGIYAL